MTTLEDQIGKDDAQASQLDTLAAMEAINAALRKKSEELCQLYDEIEQIQLEALAMAESVDRGGGDLADAIASLERAAAVLREFA